MSDISLEEELLFGNLNIKIFKLNGLKQTTGCAAVMCMNLYNSGTRSASESDSDSVSTANSILLRLALNELLKSQET